MTSISYPMIDVQAGEATDGIATLINGVVTVNTTNVKANSVIHLTVQTPPTSGLANMGTPYIANLVPGVNFMIKSTKTTDTSKVGWTIIKPSDGS